MKHHITLITLCGLLAGCQTTSSTTTVAVCPIIREWPAEWQRNLAVEVRKLPPGNLTGQALSEWLSLRDQARACLARNARIVKNK